MMAPIAGAQWSSNPNLNLAIADRSGEQVQPKVAATSDGGCYISWFDNSTGGYDVYLQRLDAGGNEQWMHNGILLADRGFSSTQNYYLDVDALDHALLTFRDDRFTGVQITATRVAPDSATLWGPTGVQLTSTGAFVAAPKIAATTDGDIVVAWTQDGSVKLNKLHPDGNFAWPAEVTLTAGGGDTFSASDLHASDDGGVIVSMVKGFFGATLHTAKLAADGSVLWGPAAVFDGGALQIANFPQFVSDDNGGAVFGWYGTGPLQCYAQHVLFDGSEQFAHNGVVASTSVSQLRVSPDVSYSAVTDEIFLFWRELSSNQSQSGIYGQKFAADGSRQWSDTGRVLVPVDATERTQVRNLQHQDGALAFWVDNLSFGNDRLKAARVDSNGDFVWTPSIIEPSSTPSDKSRLAVASSTDGFAILVWTDDRDDAGDIYAQSVNSDGTLGNELPCPIDLDGDGSVGAVDLAMLLASWGPCPGCPADFNSDGSVGAADLAQLLASWGACL